MSRMSDAQYELMKDCRDKKITARSARHTRTHCGKSGAVKFPSDYLTAKEKRKLNGECKTYRMNDPMTWAEFKELPDDLKKNYIRAIREKWNVPDGELAKMFGVSQCTVSTHLRQLGLGLGKNGRKRTWDEAGFTAWRNSMKVVESIEKEHTPPTKEDLTKFADEVDATKKAKFPHGGVYDIPQRTTYGGIVPDNGTLVFAGDARDILLTIGDILRDKKVRLTIQWSVVETLEIKPNASFDPEVLKKAATTIDYAILNEERKKALGTKG